MMVPFHCTEDDIQFAGLTCTEEDPCPIYLELTGLESTGSRIFTGGNLHSSGVTLYSILLGSEDAGVTWRELHERIRGAGLDRIQFVDPDVGLASGGVLFPLAQDPFMLLTTDGGKTWRHSAIFSDSSENHYGAIQQFSFPSKNSGSLIVDRGQGSDGDRYELYESADGGNSWTIRESSRKPLRLKAPPPVSADWRLRSDGPSRSFHIEHRQGEHWSTVAAFAVRVGACKPQ